MKKGINQIFSTDKVFGERAVYYMAPECADGYFGYKSDIFSLGIMLAVLLRLGYWPDAEDNKLDFYMRSDGYPQPHPHDRLHSAKISAEISQFIKQMLLENDFMRPSLAKVKEFFNSIHSRLKNTPNAVRHIGYIDLYFYESSTMRASVIKELLNKDEVYFVDVDNRYQKEHYIQFQQHFEGENVLYKTTVLSATSENVKKVIADHMKERCGKEPHQYDFEYFSSSHAFGETLCPSSGESPSGVIPQNFP
jgi:serine/threonine protein kinase